MNRIIKTLVVLFGFVAVYFSLGQLAFKNTIFADSKRQCCNAGQCFNVVYCSALSGADLNWDGNCDDSDDTPQDYNCYNCISDIGDGRVCLFEHNPYKWCIIPENGRRFSTWYGAENPVEISISGPTYLYEGSVGYYSANRSGGVPPIRFQWYIYYPCNGSKAAPCGYWLKIGDNSNNLSITVTREFWLKCAVTAGSKQLGNETSDVSNIIEVILAEEKSLEKDSYQSEVKNGTLSSSILNQNYPNPFNPTTKIFYSLPKSGHIILRVYDSLGKEVKELVNRFQSEGNYTAKFDASNLPSGIYFYKLQSAEFTQVRKMLLQK